MLAFTLPVLTLRLLIFRRFFYRLFIFRLLTYRLLTYRRFTYRLFRPSRYLPRSYPMSGAARSTHPKGSGPERREHPHPSWETGALDVILPRS